MGFSLGCTYRRGLLLPGWKKRAAQDVLRPSGKGETCLSAQVGCIPGRTCDRRALSDTALHP